MPTRNDNRPRSNVPPREERGSAPARPASHQEEELGLGNAKVVSMGHIESFSFSVEGELYDAWMPRIARSADGLVPVLPCRDLDSGEDSLLIVPGAFNSWLRRERPSRGTKLRLTRKGVDEASGAWRLSVTRL